MASLKEIKGRIASVGNTLKITSAMKMVASAKLHRTQGVKAALTTYAERLEQLARAARE
ncbi:MAG: F0F1 ATP synthase subunit gamma, partial [Alistipes sp.]|nr:F0F1 ATP synthase subunit gamma [Alistipes sp.]